MLPEDFHDHVLNAGKAARILLDRYFDRMETILNSLEVSTALDVGCGKGYITNFIDEMNGYSPLGLDYSIEKIRFARKEHPTLSLAIGDGTRLPFAGGSIDLVIATEVLEHQEKPERMIAETPLVRNVSVEGVASTIQTPRPHWPVSFAPNWLPGGDRNVPLAVGADGFFCDDLHVVEISRIPQILQNQPVTLTLRKTSLSVDPLAHVLRNAPLTLANSSDVRPHTPGRQPHNDAPVPGTRASPSGEGNTVWPTSRRLYLSPGADAFRATCHPDHHCPAVHHRAYPCARRTGDLDAQPAGLRSDPDWDLV